MSRYSDRSCRKCSQTYSPRSPSSQVCDPCTTFLCAYCNKSFVSRRDRKIRFCSRACTNSWQALDSTRNKARTRSRKVLGCGVFLECVRCRKGFYAPGHRISQARYCSRECRRMAVDLICPICQKTFQRPPSDIRAVNCCSNGCKNISMNRRRANGEFKGVKTKLEIAGASLLASLGVGFEEQYPIGPFLVDVLVPTSRTVILWDGDFWHANPRIYGPHNMTKVQKINWVRDRKCEKYLKKAGYKVLRFWENDVQKNPEKVTEALIEALGL